MVRQKTVEENEVDVAGSSGIGQKRAISSDSNGHEDSAKKQKLESEESSPEVAPEPER